MSLRKSAARCATKIAAGLCLQIAAAIAGHAAPISYSFTTASAPTSACLGSGGVFSLCATPIFGSAAQVSGTFQFDSAVASSGSQTNGATNYAGSLLSLSGSVDDGGFHGAFQDPSGRATVGDDVMVSGSQRDVLILAAESFVPNPAFTVTPDNLAAFTIGSLELVNVRFQWLEGQLGAPAFLTSQSLPSALPTFEGRLFLDFADPSSPSVVTAFVFFDGLFAQTQSVPEPASVALLGIAALALSTRRRAGR
jgi:hypothetical protein